MATAAEAKALQAEPQSGYGSVAQQVLSGQVEVLPVAQAVEVFEGETVPNDESGEDAAKRALDYGSNQYLGGSNNNDSSSICMSVSCIFCLFLLVVGGLLTFVFPPTDPSSPPTQPFQSQKHSPVIQPQQQRPPPPQKVIATLDMSRQGPLMDLINVVDSDTANRIVSEIDAVQQEVPGCEIQVLLVDNIAPDWTGTSKEFATALFNTWALGSIETNNGVLVLFLMDPHRIEVEVGVSLNQYMDNSWTTAMLQRRAVPEFKRGNYGFGIYNVVMSVADRLRDVENGIAIPYANQYQPAQAQPTTNYARSSNMNNSVTSDDSRNALIVFSVVLGFCCCVGSCIAYEMSYPMGMNYSCGNCGKCDWKHEHWQTIQEATYHSEGIRRRHCVCNYCGARDSKESRTAMLQRQSSHRDSGSWTRDSGGGGGYSSGDGGGGASWGGDSGGGGHSSGDGGGGASW